MPKEFISYSFYEHMVEELIRKIEGSGVLKYLNYVYGIPRGGLPIAVHLSHYFELKLMVTEPYESMETLVVDDIADTGVTLLKYRDNFRATATLYYKKRSVVKPRFYVYETNKWVVFPWEKEDEIPNRPE